MGIQRHFNKRGISLEEAQKALNAKPTITKAKPIRRANTYRGKRRNDCRSPVKDSKAKWTRIWAVGHYWFGFEPKFINRSFISKKPSKYMPHEGGGQYKKTPPRAYPGQPKQMFRGFNGRNY